MARVHSEGKVFLQDEPHVTGVLKVTLYPVLAWKFVHLSVGSRWSYSTFGLPHQAQTGHDNLTEM